jgi:FemAB-related protein (PEP-CTERM system-associated)
MSAWVRSFASEDRAEWDAYVLQHRCGTPFHLIAWKLCIEMTYGFQPMYLSAGGPEGISGLLPLFLVQNPVIGKALISSPFAVYGGILADSEEIARALWDHTCALGQQLGVEYIELRNAHSEQALETPSVDRYVTFTKTLSPAEGDLLLTLPKKTRNIVRKSFKSDFRIRIRTDGIGSFERLHSDTLRRLGTPCFPKQHFAAIMDRFHGLVDIREVLLGDRMVAASMNFFFRQTMHTYYAASDPAYNSLAPNTFMYFDHLRWASQNGYPTFDFGRSKRGTGSFEFKTHWGTEVRELPYNILPIRRRTIPNYTPANQNFAIAIKMWKRLPLPIARTLGPRIIRMFP